MQFSPPQLSVLLPSGLSLSLSVTVPCLSPTPNLSLVHHPLCQGKELPVTLLCQRAVLVLRQSDIHSALPVSPRFTALGVSLSVLRDSSTFLTAPSNLDPSIRRGVDTTVPPTWTVASPSHALGARPPPETETPENHSPETAMPACTRPGASGTGACRCQEHSMGAEEDRSLRTAGMARCLPRAGEELPSLGLDVPPLRAQSSRSRRSGTTASRTPVHDGFTLTPRPSCVLESDAEAPTRTRETGVRDNSGPPS